MKRLYHDFKVTTAGRPFLTVLACVYAAIPVVLVVVAVASLFQRADLSREAHRNCQRAAAIANYIRDAVPPKAKGPQVDRILKLERTLRSIGSCPKR